MSFTRRTLAALCLLAPALLGAQQTAAVVDLDSGWTYLERPDKTPATLPAAGDASWQRITIPHTWNALDATDMVPGYRRDGSWYRRTLDLAGRPAEARFVLSFEAANTVADVWVNGRRAGGHVGGYVGFDVDITSYVNRRAGNEILVRVDNRDDGELIPSPRSDFVIYGGLTRDVRLRVLPPAAIARLSVTTPFVQRDSARASARVELTNPAGASGAYSVRATLADPEGRVVATVGEGGTLRPEVVPTVTLNFPTLRAPRLWSPASPALYRLTVRVTTPGWTETREERVGFRWYSFQEHGPFLLNGERLLIRGTHRHEEMAGVGAALSNAQHRADMAAIKGIGANFVRLAHYPQDPEVYRAADSLGLLLWDELPWDRGGVGDSVWKANTTRLLREQIRQNANHPSIILWSLGNEVQDVIEEGHAGDTPTLRAFMTSLRGVARELDPSRPTATRKFDAGADVVDVYSPSIWAGWYGGVYRNYERSITAARAKFTRLVHMEYGGDALVGRHTETPITGEGLRLDPSVEEAVGKPVANIARDGDWSESYQTDLMDWHLMVSERQDSLSGNAQWIFRDFATPLRPENPIPYVNQKGLVTRDGTPKDAYYLYKSYWTTSPKFAYIVSHTWPERTGPKGKARTVRVYSNCDAVTLTVNDSSLGRRVRARDDFPAQGLHWEVQFADGGNMLVAQCSGAGEEKVIDRLGVTYHYDIAGRPASVRLTSRSLPNGNLLVEATLVDAKGRTSLDAADRVYFDYTGDGRLVADRGTPTGTRAIQAANGRAAIEVERPAPGGRGVLTVRTQELNGARLEVVGLDSTIRFRQ